MPLGGGNDKQGTRRGDEGSRGWLIGDAAGKGFGGLYTFSRNHFSRDQFTSGSYYAVIRSSQCRRSSQTQTGGVGIQSHCLPIQTF